MNQLHQLNRRQWLAATASSIAAMSGIRPLLAAPERPKIAALVTEFTYRSHAHVILENFLEPYLFNGKVTESGMDVVSLYVDQFPEGRDMAREVAKKYGITIYPTIAEAVTCGGKQLAVDGVLSIAEQGSYPLNDHGQQMYPRKRFFDEIVAVFRQSGRVVPLFNDKHFSYRWDWATEMMQVVKELKIPFLAGSSVPLAQRRPPVDMPENAVIEEAVALHGGPMESYDFHGMEVLQSMIESRRGGESGISEIQFLEGDAVWKAAEAGKWSYQLAEAALRCTEGKDPGPLQSFSDPNATNPRATHVILIKYRDGLRAAILRIGTSATRWGFACKLADRPEPLATQFYVGPWQNRNLFRALSHTIQSFVREGRAPYPAERTYLVTGMLAAAMDSHFEKNRPILTPHLDISYKPTDYRAMREMGDSWKIITEDVPQPEGIDVRFSKKG